MMPKYNEELGMNDPFVIGVRREVIRLGGYQSSRVNKKLLHLSGPRVIRAPRVEISNMLYVIRRLSVISSLLNAQLSRQPYSRGVS